VTVQRLIGVKDVSDRLGTSSLRQDTTLGNCVSAGSGRPRMSQNMSEFYEFLCIDRSYVLRKKRWPIEAANPGIDRTACTRRGFHPAPHVERYPTCDTGGIETRSITPEIWATPSGDRRTEDPAVRGWPVARPRSHPTRAGDSR
jgi:hypothetical protein